MGNSREIELYSGELMPAFQDIFTRIADRVNSGTLLGDLPTWIAKNTTLKGKRWSFRNHEFQIAIAKDQCPQKRVKKCSQVGLTELQLRLAFAYLRVSNGRALMYVLPLTKMAQKVSQSRIETILEGSPSLTAARVAGADSALYKRIGNSHFYMGGADKATEAISSPIDRIIIDERDFCRDRILGIYNSRMRHTEEGSEMRDEFSTPTISNYGISAGYESSDQKRYLCRCLHCNFAQAVDFEVQFVLPGFDGKLGDIEKEDIVYHRYAFDKAYVRCQQCGKPIDEALATPDQREWVAKYPTRSKDISGYWVMPTDLIKYNSAPRILKQIQDYPVQQDYWNFVLGKELDTNENKINDAIVKECFDGVLLAEGDGWCVGIDVGKYCHLFVGKKINGRRRIVYYSKLSFVNGDVFNDVCDVLDKFGFSICTIDAGPDISLPKRLQDKYGYDRVHHCYYVKGKNASSDLYEYDEETGAVNAARTRTFDHLVKIVNKRGYQFPEMPDADKKEIREHFGQMARKEEYNDEGEKVHRWVKLSDMDHYLHALAYTHLSMEFYDGEYIAVEGAVPIGGIIGAPIGGHSRSGGQQIEAAKTGDIASALRAFGFQGRQH